MKKPTLEKFRQVAEACNGVIGRMAKAMSVDRTTIYDWMRSNEKYKNVIEEYRGKLLDECLNVARLTALGIPKLKDNKVVGWVEKPDSFMLRYLIGKLGVKEGFGESIDITSKGESIKPDPVVIEVIDSRMQVKKETEGEE